ncbi:hypothetical protein E4T49_07155 [Aureobasidium sp. EXF-10728]|nr:hypothetical protein E4T49_07155 [Aureobasidium sp. EXF-10728]
MNYPESGELAVRFTVYGDYTNSFVLNHMDVVEVVVDNADSGTHPFHSNGRSFQVISRYPPSGPAFYSLADNVDNTFFDP